MLLIENKKVGKGSAAHLEILRRIGKNTVANAFLESIMSVDSEHRYQSQEYLRLALTMASYMEASARTISMNVPFDTSDVKLDERYWQEESWAHFRCKTGDYARAVQAILQDKSRNAVECQLAADLMALNALLTAAKAPLFNKLLKDNLNKSSEPLRLPMNVFLTQSEVLNFKGPPDELYKGDYVFRPGDIVAFGNHMPEAYGTWVYGVENAVCIGWMPKRGQIADFDEPLFVGGGINHLYGPKKGQPKILTESQLREDMWREIKFTIPLTEEYKKKRKCPAKPASPQVESAQQRQIRKRCEQKAERLASIVADRKPMPYTLKAELAKKAKSVPHDYDPDGKTPYKIFPYLNIMVNRIKVLGGRQDLYGKL